MTGDGLAGRLAALVGEANLLIGEAISDDYRHDEALGVAPVTPAYVVKPGTAQEVASVLKLANDSRVPVTARGSGSGLSGGAVPRARRRRRLVRADGVDRRDRHGQPHRDCPARRHARATGRGHREGGPRVPGASGRAVRQPRRQREHQRRRHERDPVRRDQATRARAGSGAGDRRDPAYRREGLQGQQRVRPDPADRRIRRHVGAGHRGGAAARAAAGTPDHAAGALQHAGRE